MAGIIDRRPSTPRLCLKVDHLKAIAKEEEGWVNAEQIANGLGLGKASVSRLFNGLQAPSSVVISAILSTAMARGWPARKFEDFFEFEVTAIKPRLRRAS